MLIFRQYLACADFSVAWFSARSLNACQLQVNTCETSIIYKTYLKMFVPIETSYIEESSIPSWQF